MEVDFRLVLFFVFRQILSYSGCCETCHVCRGGC